jgi:hypothetical protein
MSGHQLSTLDAQLASGDLLILVTGKLKVPNSRRRRKKRECCVQGEREVLTWPVLG